jgi:hypothetical protein
MSLLQPFRSHLPDPGSALRPCHRGPCLSLVSTQDREKACAQVYDAALRSQATHLMNMRNHRCHPASLIIPCKKEMAVVRSVDATASGTSTPDITSLTLHASRSRSSPPSRKRPAESDLHPCLTEVTGYTGISDSDFPMDMSQTVFMQKGPRSFVSHVPPPPPPPLHFPGYNRAHPEQAYPTKPVLSSAPPRSTDIPRFDPRYPDLVLQPDSRPISQEQLTSEVKSICDGNEEKQITCLWSGAASSFY